MAVLCHLQSVCLLFLLDVAVGLRRGPHHPHGQSPVERRHHHYRPRGVDSLTAEAEVLHDIKHLEEDIKVLTAEALAKMAPDELEFHYFSAHDFDKNSKLDGLELLKSVYHTIHHDSTEVYEDNPIEPNEQNFDDFIALVDLTLETDDTDGDGYVSYAEYRAARARNPGDKPPIVMTVNKP